MAEATVLIPAFNEEATVGRVVRVAREAGFPVVVADDGSKDETARRALEAGAEVVRLKENRGKGGAIAEGLKAVRTPFVLLLDADLLGLRPEHLFALLKPLKEGEARMAVGSSGEGGPPRTWPCASPLSLGPKGPPPGGPEERARPGKGPLRSGAPPHPARQAGGLARGVRAHGGGEPGDEGGEAGVLAGLGHRLRMYWEILRYRLRAR